VVWSDTLYKSDNPLAFPVGEGGLQITLAIYKPDEARAGLSPIAFYKSDIKSIKPHCSPLLVKTNSALRQFNKLNRQKRYVVFPLPKKSLLRKSFLGALFLRVAGPQGPNGCGLTMQVDRKEALSVGEGGFEI
jgi:hypothetical protein